LTKQKILVIQTAFIGDAILATALLESLHKAQPHAEIHFLVRKGNESLFDGHPFIQKLLVWNKKEGKYRSLLKMIRTIRSEKYDQLINIQRFASSGLLTIFSKAKFTVGFSKNPLSIFFRKRVPHIIGEEEGRNHETDRNLKLIEHIPDVRFHPPALYPTEDHRRKIKDLDLPSSYVCLAPASVWFTKQYPAEKWLEFMNSLSKSLTPVLIGAPSDHDLCEELIEKSGRQDAINLTGKLDLLGSAVVMQGAQMNFVNDSAPMHLCSSVNAPVTAIYCSTVPSFGFGPLSDQSFIVQTKEELACRPCGLHGFKKCPRGHFRCALGIENEQLLSILEKRIEK
jgi:heptosyltransferase-2